MTLRHHHHDTGIFLLLPWHLPGRGSGCAIGLPRGHFLGNRRAGVDDGYRTTVNRRATLDQNHCCYNSYPLLIHFLTSSQKHGMHVGCTITATSHAPNP